MSQRESAGAPRERILVVDDSAPTVEILRRNLESCGYAVLTARDVPSALRVLDSAEVDLVITDWKMPHANGIDLVRYVRENLPDTQVMMITGFATIDGAVEAVKAGAEDYLSKPFTDEELFAAVDRALDRLQQRRAARRGPAQAAPAYPGLIAGSAAMRRVCRAVAKAATTDATVLIQGESGTGKELVARAIHYSGPRAGAPFVPVNCGGIPEALVESELFGHTRGAFTGAVTTRAGFFITADGGTIFLDEIGELGTAMQVKLLRVLEDRMVYMVGSSRGRPVDVRVIAATNKDLRGLVAKGSFREDLFFRLNVIVIDLPPLRERDDDVLVLTRHFAEQFAADAGRPAPRFSDAALQVLRGYRWPGNVRELKNVLQRLVVMSDGDVIDVPDLPALMRFSPLRGGEPLRTLAEVEREYARHVLERVGGNKTRAAEILGIDRKTLREKLSDSPAS